MLDPYALDPEAEPAAGAADDADGDLDGGSDPEAVGEMEVEDTEATLEEAEGIDTGGEDLESSGPDGIALLERCLAPHEERPLLVDRTFPEEDLDPEALKIVHRLQRHGHAAFLVGGCVRDLLAGLHPKDFDIATSATPRQIKRLFRNCRIIGRRFKLIHIFFRDGKIIEVATFRSAPEAAANGEEELLIVDDNTFGTAREDAFRRDFTINALLYDPFSRKIVDFVSGVADIERERIRSIGDPDIRFREDPVRMLRALKFAARLAFEIEVTDRQALSRHRTELLKAPMARLLEEIHKMLGCGAAAECFRGLKLTNILQVLLPTVDSLVQPPGEGSPLFWKLLEILDRTSGGKRIYSNAVMLACLVHPCYLASTGEEPGHGSYGHQVKWLAKFFDSCDLLRQVPRRDKLRVRSMLAGLRRFDPATRGGRTSLKAFLHREYFPDLFAYWKLLVEATGKGTELVEEWTERAMPLFERRSRAPESDGDSRPEASSADEFGPEPGLPSGGSPRESRFHEGPRLPPGERQPPRGANQPRYSGFGVVENPDPFRGYRQLGFGATHRAVLAPMGFGEAMRSNLQIRLASLGFGEDSANAVARTGMITAGFGAEGLLAGKPPVKKKLPIIPGVNTGDGDPALASNRRRKRKNRRVRRDGRRPGGGGGGGGGGMGSGGRPSGQGGRRRRRRNR